MNLITTSNKYLIYRHRLCDWVPNMDPWHHCIDVVLREKVWPYVQNQLKYFFTFVFLCSGFIGNMYTLRAAFPFPHVIVNNLEMYELLRSKECKSSIWESRFKPDVHYYIMCMWIGSACGWAVGFYI